VAGGGGSIGLVLGGMLTDWASWRWGLFINVPIGIALMWLAPRHLPETERSSGRFDLTGALTATAGMTALVYGFVRAAAHGWGNGGTVAAFTASALLLAGFVLNEARAEQPITPLRLFASRERSGALIARVLLVSGIYGMFFFVTQFLQGALGYSPLQAGLAFLPMTVVLFVTSQLLPRVAARAGNVRPLMVGVLLGLFGMTWLSRLSAGTHFFPEIALPLFVLGIGMGLALAPLTSAGIAGVAPADAGAASGLVNTAHQLGGSLGLSILVTIFAGAARSAAHHPVAHAPGVEARHVLAHGVATSLTGSAALLALALAAIVLVMRGPLRRERVPVAEPVQAG